jgi:predicted house-cleaning noncanonical NTP pyrophosphatase (MazG superfamily)
MRAAGQAAVVHTADPVEFGVLLRQKLTEEVDEFLTSHDPEELADILEVLYALADCLGLDAAGLEDCGERRLSCGVDSRSGWCGMGQGQPCPRLSRCSLALGLRYQAGVLVRRSWQAAGTGRRRFCSAEAAALRLARLASRSISASEMPRWKVCFCWLDQ